VRALGLVNAFKAKDLPDADQQLLGMTKLNATTEGLITITVRDTSAQRAAVIANEFVTQMDKANGNLVLTPAGEEARFLQQEVDREKSKLETAEMDLTRAQEGMRGLAPESQARLGISSIEDVRAQLSVAEVKLSALLTSETDANPELVRQRAEIARLSAELGSLQHGAGNDLSGTPTSQIPQENLQFTQISREVKFHEAMLEGLMSAYQQAELQEAKDPNIVQVLDPAVAPLHKAWPHRTLFCLMALFTGVGLGILLVLLMEFRRRAIVSYHHRVETFAGRPAAGS
jgi:tyrosine-protein kinase Etk/Wzc